MNEVIDNSRELQGSTTLEEEYLVAIRHFEEFAKTIASTLSDFDERLASVAHLHDTQA
jgi:hypothetical protein